MMASWCEAAMAAANEAAAVVATGDFTMFSAVAAAVLGRAVETTWG